MEEKFKGVIKSLSPQESSNSKLKSALKWFFSKEEISSSKIVYIICLPLTVFITLLPETVSLIKNFSDLSQTILITIFAGLLTFYTIIISIISKNNIKTLVKVNSGSKTLLESALEYYERNLMMYFIGIFSTFILQTYLELVPDNYNLTKIYVLDCLLAFIPMYIYITTIFRLIYELKSTIYNTIMLSNSSIINTIKEIIEEVE